MERDYVEMMSSLVTIIVSIIAVAVFIYYGNSAVFYIVVVIAILVAAVNAWLLSNPDSLKSIIGKMGASDMPKLKPGKRKGTLRKRKKR